MQRQNKRTTMTSKTIKVEGFGNVYLEPTSYDTYSVSDAQGNFMGEIDPSEVEDWDDNDEIIIGQCIADLMDNGELETPSSNEDSYEDF